MMWKMLFNVNTQVQRMYKSNLVHFSLDENDTK